VNETTARALGERAVRCRGWRWMPRMKVLSESEAYSGTSIGRLLGHGCAQVIDIQERSVVLMGARLDTLTPDLRDPATLGCIVPLVREALQDPLCCAVARNKNEWEVRAKPGTRWDLVASGTTEAEAWIAAWEAAP